MDNQKREKLLLRLINLVSTKYKNQIILKGGMSLRLYNSPRYTQDIDFVMTTKVSRKIIAEEIKEMIEKEGDIVIDSLELNSRGIFIDVKMEDTLAQIEISIKKKLDLDPVQLSTASLALPLKMAPQIITVMNRSESFANKIAASLERDTIRDLYDITLYELDTQINMPTLRARLDKLCVNREKPLSLSYKEAGERLREKLDKLDKKSVHESLSGMIQQDYLAGSLELIKTSVTRVIHYLENFPMEKP